MIRAHSVDTPTVSTGSTTNRNVKKKTPAASAKRSKGKNCSSRKNYKRLKFKLKGLIEEGVILKETLRRKEEQLVEMSRDIHYILGRLLPYQKDSSQERKQEEMSNKSPESSMNVPDPFDQQDIKSESQTSSSWDGYPSVDSGKNRINFSLPPEVERQLASVYPPLTLPDDIFSES